MAYGKLITDFHDLGALAPLPFPQSDFRLRLRANRKEPLFRASSPTAGALLLILDDIGYDWRGERARQPIATQASPVN